ncbi:signal peptidase II [Diaminobutyricimonas sp. TR449]|uniref:signal peptidase II n=1 Tax=Diaminobutyricimonas sp. TR449 TaxID=2708076 RepID=UPI00244489C9|nr:signal peptidase II [Diaminobutyricimonas sp. TR449]
MPETTEPQAGRASATKVSLLALALLAVVAVVVYAVDQGSKFLITTNFALGDPVPILGELLTFRYVKNPGAAFSFGIGMTWIFSIVAAGVVVFILAFARRIRSVAWALMFGMLLGGALGNLTDRLFREPSFGQGHVIDFIQVWGFPAIFNVADIFIVSSMGLFIILTVRGIGLDGKRTVEVKPEPAPTPGADVQ